MLTTWTPLETALLNSVHKRIIGGRYLDEVLEIIELLDQRIGSEEGRLSRGSRTGIDIKDGLFACCYVSPHKAAGISYIADQLSWQRFSRADDVIGRTFENRLLSGRLSLGQAYVLLCCLVRMGAVVAPLIQRAIEIHWGHAPYHLQLTLMEAAKMCGGCDDASRIALVEAIQDLPRPRSIYVSSEITEALVCLGALEGFGDGIVDEVRKEIRLCIEDPTNCEKCSLAIKLYSAQFEDIYGSSHIEAIGELGSADRKVFLGMAAMGATDEPLIRVPLLIELGALCDSNDGEKFIRWTASPQPDELLIGEGIEISVTAHIILARLCCGLPEGRSVANNPGSLELAAYGEILYWCNRFDLSETMRHRACDKPLSLLVLDKVGVSLDVIRRCEHLRISNLDRLLGTERAIVSILESFPEAVVQICRRSLADTSRLITYYPAFTELDHRNNLIFATNVIGLYGTSTDLRTLRDWSNDPDLGSKAIEAAKALEERLASK